MIGTFRELLALIDAPRPRVALSAVLGALTVIFGMGLMATAGYLISRAAERPAILSLEVTIVLVRFFGLGRPVVRYLERLVSHDLALRVLGNVRTRFYRRIEPLAPAELDRYRSGDLLSRMVADVDSLQNLQLRVIGPPLVALLAGAVSVGVAAAFVPAAGLVLAVGLLAGAVAGPMLAGVLSRGSGRRLAAARGALGAEVVEVIGAGPELVVLGCDEAALAKLRDADGALVRLSRRDALAAGAADGLGLVITGITVAGVLAVAVGAAHAGSLARVDIALLALLALASFEAVTPLATAARELSSTVAAGGRLLELIDHPVAVVDPVTPAPAPAWPFAVAFEGVRARYPGQPRAALNGLTLRLDPGARIALIGPSGSGKTTVTNLLLRFLDPSDGRVTLAGRDLREYRQQDIRRLISVAGQDSHLFATSIRANVRLARPDASDQQLEDALGRARIWDWIQSLPQGLDTLVGEEGRELSGGQRQRIVLARALLADAPVLVLDEPTAHLDPETAARLIDDVFACAGNKTVLLITHRPEGLELVEEIVSL